MSTIKTNTITIYGASDDLVEVEGPFGDEFGCYDRAMTLALDDGTKVRVAYSEAGDGCWRVEVLALGEGAEVVEHFKATDSDSDDYSDKLTLCGSFTKITRKTKSALKKIDPPPPAAHRAVMERLQREFKEIGDFEIVDTEANTLEEVEAKAKAHIEWFREWAIESAQHMERELEEAMREAEASAESSTGGTP